MKNIKNRVHLPFWTKNCWVFILIACIFFALLLQYQAQHLIDMLGSLGHFAPCLFLLLYCLMSIFCLPTFLLALAGGILFGPVIGSLLNVLGATLGAILGFCISRYLGKDQSWFRWSKHTAGFIYLVERQGWKSVALLRLTPVIPANVVNYGFGLTKIKFSHYLIPTIIFVIPSKIIVTYCGYYGKTIYSYFS